jgi:hypothetical protein
VQQQQPQARSAGLLGEGQHRQVAVGVPGGKDRPPPEAM